MAVTKTPWVKVLNTSASSVTNIPSGRVVMAVAAVAKPSTGFTVRLPIKTLALRPNILWVLFKLVPCLELPGGSELQNTLPKASGRRCDPRWGLRLNTV